jgi:membrane associated rhomboid family serine protease
MRDDYRRERTSFLTWLLSAIIAGFVIQMVFSVWLETPGFENLMALSAGAVRRGFAWTLLTYPLLHLNVLHLLVVVLSIFFIGRELLNHVGERRLAGLALASTAVGGLLWFAVHFNRGGELVGATPILWCYFTVFACLFANREISFLLFFVLPITTRPKYILWIMLGLDAIGFLFSELPAKGFVVGSDTPHSAHLAAMLVGWLYYRFAHEANWLVLRPRADIELPRWMKRPKKAAAAAPTYQVNVGGPARSDLRAEVDRILDKINSHGFGALTADEKRLLDEARDLLSRR